MPSRPGFRNRRNDRARTAPPPDTGALLPPEMLPHELLLAVARGRAIDGHVPSFAERVAAARQASPFYAPRISPEKQDARRPLCITIRRFSDESEHEGADGIDAVGSVPRGGDATG